MDSVEMNVADGQSERELLATLAGVKDQLSLLGLKAAIAFETVSEDFAGLDSLAQRLDQLERGNQAVLGKAVAGREEAMVPSMMAKLRRPAAMPFRKDTKLQGFAQLITANDGDGERQAAALEDEYARAASELSHSLQQSGKLLSDDEADLLQMVERAKAALQAQSDAAADRSAHQKAEEALQKLLVEASAQGAVLAASRAEVAAAENEATRMVDSAQHRRLAAMAAAEESRQILSGATLALKRLGRAEWSEIKGIGSPGESIVRLMGAVRLLLGDVKAATLSAGSPIPTDWSLCVKLMSHTRFVSRLLKLTRGTSKAAPVVFLILERNLKPDDLDAKVRTSRSVAVLGQWLGSLLQYKEVAESGEKAKIDLKDAETDVRQAAETLKQKSADAKKIQGRTQRLNTRISQLMAAAESVPHRQSLARLKEYQTLRSEVETVSQAHEQLVTRIQVTQQLSVMRAESPSREGHREGGSSRQVVMAATGRRHTSEVAAVAVEALDRIKLRHREQAAAARDQLKRMGRRDQLQKGITTRAITAAADNDTMALTKLVREHAAHCAMHADPLDQWEVLSCRDADGRTPLHYACCHGRYESAIYLLTAGAEPTLADTVGFTALHFAAAYGHLRAIVLLNQFDPKLVDVTDRRGQTPLHVACQAEPPHPDVVSLLLRLGADIGVKDADEQTALNLTPNDSQLIRGVLQQHDEDLEQEDEAPVVTQALEDLHAEFADADDAFDKLVTSMHFGDNKVGSENESSDDFSSEESSEESSEDEPMLSGGGGSGTNSDAGDGAPVLLTKAEILRRRSQQVVDRQEFEEAEAAPVEVKIATKDSGRLSMSIFGHVNASVRHAKEAAAARAESEVDLDADGPGEGEASEEGALVEAVSVNGSLEDWFGTDGAADLLPDRIVNATGGVLATAALPFAGAHTTSELLPSSLGMVETARLETTSERVAAAELRRKKAAAQPESMMVRYWREKHLNGDELGDISYGDWYKHVSRPATPPAKKIPSLTPNERVKLRSVLPPPAVVKNKAEKTMVKLKRDKKTGKYIATSVVIEKPKNNFFADHQTSGS